MHSNAYQSVRSSAAHATCTHSRSATWGSFESQHAHSSGNAALHMSCRLVPCRAAWMAVPGVLCWSRFHAAVWVGALG